MRSLALMLIGCLLFCEGVSQSRVGGIQVLGKYSTTDMLIADVWGYTDEQTGKEYGLLCATADGLFIVDVSDPKIPQEVARVAGEDFGAFDVKTWKNYAYVVSGSTSPGGKIIDLTNPENPGIVGSFQGGHNIFISDEGFLYIASPGLSVYDLNDDPLRPSFVYTDNDCVGHDVAIIGERLYDFAWNCGTRIFDISQPRNMKLLGTIPATNSPESHSGWPSEDGKYLFVAHEHFIPSENDISVVDISDLSSPILIGSYADPDATAHNIYVIDDHAYVSYYMAGMKIFDISDPTNITIVSEFDNDPNSNGEGFGGFFGLYTDWGANKILASVEEQGLLVLNFADISTSTDEQLKSAKSNLEVYPNPTTDQINLEFTLSDKQNVEILTTNVSGKVISEDRFFARTIDVARSYSLGSLGEGMYFIVVKTGDSFIYRKIVVSNIK